MKAVEFIIIGDADFCRHIETVKNGALAILDKEDRRRALKLSQRWWSPEELNRARQDKEFVDKREDLVRDLNAARFAAIQLDLGPIALYALGAREALTSGITLACHSGPQPAWGLELLRPHFVPLGELNEARMAEHLKPLREEGLRAWTNQIRAARAVKVSEEPQRLGADGTLGKGDTTLYGPEREWRHEKLPAGRPFLALRYGDIAKINDIDCWVNTENTHMQMARVTDPSISARIRYLGSRRTGPDRADTDDAIYLELARAMGSRRRLEVGDVLMTRAPPRSPLAEQNKVKAVAHVAAVVPLGPMRGFGPGGDIGGCVKNTLDRVYKFADEQELAIKSVLFPLLAAGDAGVAPPIAASQMVGALKEWMEADGAAQAHFEKICFVAHSLRARDAIVEALSAYGFKP